MSGLRRLTLATLMTLAVTSMTASSAVAGPAASPEALGSPSIALAPSATPTTVIRAYFLLADPAGGTSRLVPVLRQIPATSARAYAAMDALLAGPSRREASAGPAIRTALAKGTRLLGLRVESGTATVNLDGAFLGASARVTRGRAAQVTYTLTQSSTITRVRILVGGKALAPVAGLPEGSITRTTFRDEWLPAIFVDRPAWGSLFGSGTRVSGLTNVFEARFRLRVTAANGRVLLDRAVVADLAAGAGGWRGFSVPITYRVTTYQQGIGRVYDRSEVDGRAQDIRDYPVLLDPD